MTGKRLFLNQRSTIFLLSILWILILFFILQPKLRPHYQAIGNNFNATDVVQNDGIDPHALWQKREFYSPGITTVEKKAIEDEELNNMYNPVKFKEGNYFLVDSFKSKQWISADFLVSESKLSDLISIQNIENNVIENEQQILAKTKDDKTIFIFLHSIGEMEKTVGFLDYKEYDKELIEGKNWLHVSIIE